MSDWLTKIIVGLGLVELHDLPADLQSCAEYISRSFALKHAGDGIALAIILYFWVAGFLVSYLVMSAIRELVKAEPVDLVRGKVTELAQEYLEVRGSEAPGDARTARMQGIVNKMKGLGLSIEPLLPDLKDSRSPGERLALVASLQMQPRAEYIDWLGARFAIEAPFVYYQSALALLAAAEKLPAENAKIRAAIITGQSRRGQKQGSDTDRVLAAAMTKLTA